MYIVPVCLVFSLRMVFIIIIIIMYMYMSTLYYELMYTYPFIMHIHIYRDIMIREPNILYLEAPLLAVGDIHGQVRIMTLFGHRYSCSLIYTIFSIYYSYKCYLNALLYHLLYTINIYIYICVYTVLRPIEPNRRGRRTGRG